MKPGEMGRAKGGSLSLGVISQACLEWSKARTTGSLGLCGDGFALPAAREFPFPSTPQTGVGVSYSFCQSTEDARDASALSPPLYFISGLSN